MNPILGAHPMELLLWHWCARNKVPAKTRHLMKEHKRSFFMEEDESGCLVLKKEHAYYYQVQFQK